MITLKQVAASIEPNWTLNEWFQWPPNVFALISIVLQRTGAYKVCLEQNAHWEAPEWLTSIKKDGKDWLRNTNKYIAVGKQSNFIPSEYKELKRTYELLDKDWNETTPLKQVDLNKLRLLGEQSQINDPLKFTRLEYAKALVSILAIVDSCCAGLGIIGGTIPDKNDDNTLFRTFANLLLTTTGSVSTVLKFHGTVIPKMRTPQSGIVLRSLSHHLTFHQTEVDVVWRTFPWLDDSKQHLNVMVVPFPYEIFKTDFEAVQNKYHNNRYFTGKIQEYIHIDFLDMLVEEVCRKTLTNNEVDLLVFPEMSLSEKQYNYLLNRFADRYVAITDDKLNYSNKIDYCRKLPIVVAGVLNQRNNNSGAQIEPMDNEARIAVFFSGKWYDITQSKHHRWQLDRTQVLQYGFEGYLSADQSWVEYCSILQRRLTILAPNGWLSLTALICEDLARQEPVGEVLRGIGPTLLTALLSDGPQINARWSARYASVLADDPGTSVLSITSRGMAARSRKPDGTVANSSESLAIGLWKDLIKGWSVLELEPETHALLFTISSKFEKEYTIDGRSDDSSSSVFRMDSFKPRQIKLKLSDRDIRNELRNASEKKSTMVANMTKSERFGNWHDIRTLSIHTFTVDAVVDLCVVYENKDDVIAGMKRILELYEKSKRDSGSSILTKIKKDIKVAWENPEKIGTSTSKNDSTDANMKSKAVEVIEIFVNDVFESKTSNTNKTIYEEIVNACNQRLGNSSKREDLTETIAMIFLYNVNSKLSFTVSSINTEQACSKVAVNWALNKDVAMKLTVKIRSIIENYIKTPIRKDNVR